MSLLHQIHVQGNWERRYQIYLPANYKPERRVPLLLALHGGDLHSMIKLTNGGFNVLADEHNFIVVYPEPLGGHQWNDARLKPRWGREVDDVGYIRSLIDQLVAFYAIDKRRVYVAGMSSGGFMAYRLGCDLPDRIGGIAAVAALLPVDLTPERPMPLLTIAGRDDPIVPYNGGTVGSKLLRQVKVHSGMETLRRWSEANRCGGETSTELVEQSDRVQRITYPDCVAPVELYNVIGGGHTWPGGSQYLDERIVGKTNPEFDANQVIWNFFRSLSEEE